MEAFAARKVNEEIIAGFYEKAEKARHKEREKQEKELQENIRKRDLAR